MIKKIFLVALSCLLLNISFTLASDAHFTHSIFFGAHYFRTLGEIKEEPNFDKDGYGINFGYQLGLSSIFSVQAVVQTYPSGFYDAENAWSLEGYAIIGRGIYAGVGILTYKLKWKKEYKDYHEEEGWSNLNYALKAGFELPLVLDVVYIDVNAKYLFNNWQDVKEFDEDTLTFGASVKVVLVK